MTDIKQEASVRLIGRLREEPVRKVTRNNTAVINFMVETEIEDGDKIFRGNHRVTLWGHRADDFLALNPHERDLVCAEGNIYNKKDDQGIWRIEISWHDAKILEPVEQKIDPEPSAEEMPF